jgi:hypothetical protein
MRNLSLYHASGSTITEFKQPSLGKLFVEGIVVDAVSVVGPELKDLSLDQINSTLDKWQRIAEAEKEAARAKTPL